MVLLDSVMWDRLAFHYPELVSECQLHRREYVIFPDPSEAEMEQRRKQRNFKNPRLSQILGIH
jgi:hypothetical protein